jgi:serine/threonine protein kinase
MPLSDGQTFAGYRIVRLLGSGGMGGVYLAEHPRLPRRDALKVLPADISGDADYRARFNREADLASKLWHPHIVSVHDRGEGIGEVYCRIIPCMRDFSYLMRLSWPFQSVTRLNTTRVGLFYRLSGLLAAQGLP